MLTTKLRRQLEWHFYNYKADLALSGERERDIIESGLCVAFSHVGSRSRLGSPTEGKAMRIAALGHGQDWAAVVLNTFNAFRFEPEYDIMTALYEGGIPKQTIIKKYFADGLWERTFYRWRDKWLEYAYNWAKEFKLL
jgi:hypothetical protein